ncbi:MAG: hypothetical protein V3U96_04695 [Paracoccaceae bacterium]
MKAPWHIWVVGIAALLWNAGGAYDYVMTVTENSAYMANFTPDQLSYFYGFPSWVMAAWAIAIWAAVLGSVLLLLRSRHAALAFGLSILGIIATTLYSFVLSGVNYGELVGKGALWFTLAIGVVAVLLWLYARAMHQRGVLS